jgi:hypothetical protein
MILQEETTLGHLSDRRTVVLVANDAISTNLSEAIDWGVNETQEHDSWRTNTSIDAHEQISEKIGRLQKLQFKRK